MRRTSVSFLVLALVVVALAGARAVAEETAGATGRLGSSLEPTQYLAETASAVVGTSAAVTSAWGGYDGASRVPVFSVGTELRVVRHVALVAGVAYGSNGSAAVGLRPVIGARVQFLEQAAFGVDASAAFLFRQDRFTAEDGLFQGVIALGRSFGETSVVANIVYAQDGEGDDHQGELHLAGFRRLRGGLGLGFEGRYMHAIASTDPHRAALGTPSMEAAAGPLVAYMAGGWALLAEVGVTSRQTSRLDVGMVTLAGVGTTF